MGGESGSGRSGNADQSVLVFATNIPQQGRELPYLLIFELLRRAGAAKIRTRQCANRFRDSGQLVASVTLGSHRCPVRRSLAGFRNVQRSVSNFRASFWCNLDLSSRPSKFHKVHYAIIGCMAYYNKRRGALVTCST